MPPIDMLSLRHCGIWGDTQWSQVEENWMEIYLEKLPEDFLVVVGWGR